MNKQNTKQNYQQRLERVINHISDNLADDLDVNQLAEVANFSPYHFHRIYREMISEPVNVTVRRLRLHHAARDLISTERPVLTIAKNVGYGSVEAFSRAFSKAYGFTPVKYRTERKQHCYLTEPALPTLANDNKGMTMFTVEMMDLEETQLAGLSHVGDYMKIGTKFEHLFMQAGILNLLDENTRSMGLYYGDPESVPEEELRSAACISIANSQLATIEPSELQSYVLPKGQYATVLFKGPYSELSQAYSWLFGHWLPNSGLQVGNFPPVEEYLNNPRETAPEELLTRIHCLIQS